MARILLVDDDADQLELRTLLLEREGHRIRVAGNALQALETAAEGADAVLMDLRVPLLEDGLELIRSLRANYPSLFIAVLSGAAPELERRPERALVDAVFRKPVRTEALLAALRRLAGVAVLLLLSSARGWGLAGRLTRDEAGAAAAPSARSGETLEVLSRGGCRWKSR